MTDILDRLENFSLYSYPPGEGVYKMMALHRAAKAALEAKDAEIELLTAALKASLRCGPEAEIGADRWLAAQDEIAKLRDHLKRSLRQWSMYAEMVEGNDGFDLATEQSPEGEIYREAHALANEQRMPQEGK